MVPLPGNYSRATVGYLSGSQLTSDVMSFFLTIKLSGCKAWVQDHCTLVPALHKSRLVLAEVDGHYFHKSRLDPGGGREDKEG